MTRTSGEQDRFPIKTSGPLVEQFGGQVIAMKPHAMIVRQARTISVFFAMVAPLSNKGREHHAHGGGCP